MNFADITLFPVNIGIHFSVCKLSVAAYTLYKKNAWDYVVKMYE